MNKKEVIAEFARKNQITKAVAAREVDACLDTIKEALEAGEKVVLPGFGVFEVSERAQREGRNPRTGERITIASSKIIRFRPGKDLKDRVKK